MDIVENELEDMEQQKTYQIQKETFEDVDAQGSFINNNPIGSPAVLNKEKLKYEYKMNIE